MGVAILSGFAGTLSGPGSGLLVSVGIPLAFTSSLALFTASRCTAIRDSSCSGDQASPGLGRVRVCSRQIYLLLYTLYAAKELQFVVRNPGEGAAPAAVMHALWPYLAGACVALALARYVAWRGPRP